MAIREHLPSAKELASWPAVKIMRIGHGALDAAHRIKEVPDIARLDFNGDHALQPGKEQKTIYDMGITPPILPLSHPPKHELKNPESDLTVTVIEDTVTPAKNNPNYLYTHSGYMRPKSKK
jgi:hypothetical protein